MHPTQTLPQECAPEGEALQDFPQERLQFHAHPALRRPQTTWLNLSKEQPGRVLTMVSISVTAQAC